MHTTEQVIAQTKKWITDVVIGCNFCPFAAREVKRNSVNYIVEESNDIATCLHTFIQECVRMDNDAATETSFIIYPNAFENFEDYLDLVSLAETLLERQDYEGIYQAASFHPQYSFQDAATDDAANYTNRSIYPMLHILREESVETALDHYADPEDIPERNIKFAREKGVAYMKLLRDSCL
ncbi:DUF1415 domain-containing protein [Panacibacter ginsenosidivorans]|uniref:DUF1415 domain-containing protein n=1 Tax=Panacibacter ginsenosidivorans TaxID=1813871 RepID=A0A5B8VE13_9BACT|nr:DUF1415 domain-containing protein [Panacibacter ginsenosidivorans]QEC69499.1 DUF1415 domain-containing protein [Panacibacter ginsenosidivorans]